MKNIILLISFCFFGMNCNTNSVRNKKNRYIKQDAIKTEGTSAIYSSLFKEIQDFISYRDSLESKSGHLETKIIGVIFKQMNNHDYVEIWSTIYYHSKAVKGFIILEGRMIVFAGDSSVLVDISKLKKNIPKEYPDENSEIVKNITYDPFGRRFKIHTKDSLELVYTGGF